MKEVESKRLADTARFFELEPCLVSFCFRLLSTASTSIFCARFSYFFLYKYLAGFQVFVLNFDSSTAMICWVIVPENYTN